MRFKHEIQAGLVGAVVFVVRCAQRQGGDVMFLSGALALAEHRALVEGLDWKTMLSEARISLGAGTEQLLDAALQIEA